MPKSPNRDKLRSARNGRVRPLSELLGSGNPRNDVQLAVAQGAAGLAQTRAWLCALLPEELAGHITQALERNGELTRLRADFDNPERRRWLNENVDVCVDGSAVTNKRS